MDVCQSDGVPSKQSNTSKWPEHQKGNHWKMADWPQLQHKCETWEMLEKKCSLLALFMLKHIIFKEIQSSKIKRFIFIKAEHHKYTVGLWMKSSINWLKINLHMARKHNNKIIRIKRSIMALYTCQSISSYIKIPSKLV